MWLIQIEKRECIFLEVSKLVLWASQEMWSGGKKLKNRNSSCYSSVRTSKQSLLFFHCSIEGSFNINMSETGKRKIWIFIELSSSVCTPFPLFLFTPGWKSLGDQKSVKVRDTTCPWEQKEKGEKLEEPCPPPTPARFWREPTVWGEERKEPWAPLKEK